MSTVASKTNVEKFESLIQSPIEIAIDTEFQDIHTLTVQAAMRRKDKLFVKVFRSPEIPSIPKDFDVDAYLPITADKYGRFCSSSKLWSDSRITSSLSPVGILRDLLGYQALESLSRKEGEIAITDHRAEIVNAHWDEKRKRWILEKIHLVLIGHFLAADFGRVFGREFYTELFAGDGVKPSPVGLASTRRLAFVESYKSFFSNAPVIEYAKIGMNRLYEVHVETRDTMLPFDKSKLDELSKTFLGIPKSDGVTSDEKREMKKVFQEKTAEAYGYAMVDAVNTLLVYEQMKEKDQEIYRAFDVPDDDIPAMAATVGGRVRDFLLKMSDRHTQGSSYLPTKNKLKRLMEKGGIAHFNGPHAVSRFGSQTGVIHGGLLFSRTPTTFWHHAPGLIRDVDFSGCYNSILANMNVYWGRPAVLEPGSRAMTLAEAIRLMREFSPDDAWFIRVTGNISSIANTLIPSTINATTHETFRVQIEHARLLAFRNQLDQIEQAEGSKLFSHRIESGVVTLPTWLMIQAMPESAKTEYENLRVESVVFYHKRFIADDGREFDDKYNEFYASDLPWDSEFCHQTLQKITKEPLDHEYVSLRFPISEYARRIGEERSQAKKKFGKGSGQDFAWKTQANTMYGVLVCEHFPTNNVIAGNYITAHARAEAHAMMQALNGLQVITDGSSYRRDRIPACSFAECLEVMPDYPLRHADEKSGIPFHDPKDVPVGDEEFTQWYRDHVKRFFQVEGNDYDKLFDTHRLEHKATGQTDRMDCDALACDGSGNYLKLLEGDDDGGFSVCESKMRGYGRGSKDELEKWIMEVYANDRMEDLPPITTDKLVLKLKPAKQKVKKALATRQVEEIYLPLSLDLETVRCFKVLKPSAFVFHDPAQYKKVSRQLNKFHEATGCGLDLVVLRQSKGDRHQFSIADLAREIFDYIQSGGRDFTKKFNLSAGKLSKKHQQMVKQRQDDIRDRKARADEVLLRKINVDNQFGAEELTGIVISSDNLHLIR